MPGLGCRPQTATGKLRQKGELGCVHFWADLKSNPLRPDPHFLVVSLALYKSGKRPIALHSHPFKISAAQLHTQQL
jgi:hypothetical protein